MIRQELMVELNKVTSIEELKEVYDYLRTMSHGFHRKREITASSVFKIGDKVWFISSNWRHPGRIYGTITKVNAMSCKVYDEYHKITWTVSPSLLKLLDSSQHLKE